MKNRQSKTQSEVATLSESSIISNVEAAMSADDVAEFLEEFSDFGPDLLDNFHHDVERARAAAVEDYAGCYSSAADFARTITEQAIPIPEQVRSYIDYGVMARDIECGDIYVIESGLGKAHIFWVR